MAPLDGLAAVTLLSQNPSGQQCANTFHISKAGASSPPSTSDLATLADDLNTFLTTTYRAVIASEGTFVSIKVAQVPDPTIHDDPYADYLLPLNLAGTRTVTHYLLPQQACICLSLKTNSGQRSYRGHQLLPSCLSSDDANGQSFNTSDAYYEAAVAYAAKLIDGCGASPSWTGSLLPDYSLSIYSKTLQSAGHPSVTGCITVVTNSLVHWLRSRNRGTT